jgi:predicted RNase H-like HicB family nuclease
MESGALHYTVECEQDAEGRWLAEALELPGVLVYGQTPEEVINKVQVQALRAIAALIEHCPPSPALVQISFSLA